VISARLPSSEKSGKSMITFSTIAMREALSDAVHCLSRPSSTWSDGSRN
jgi:hypothetical protein